MSCNFVEISRKRFLLKTFMGYSSYFFSKINFESVYILINITLSSQRVRLNVASLHLPLENLLKKVNLNLIRENIHAPYSVIN